MVLFIILGMIVLLALGVLGVLFFMLGKEGQKPAEKAEPVADLKRFQPQQSKAADEEVIPAFVPKVSIPVAEVKVPVEDSAYKKRSEELEVELKAISLKAESQKQEAAQIIEALTEENDSLKRQKAALEDAQQKLNTLAAETDTLKTENLNLQSQLEASSAKARLLEEEMAAVKVQMGEEISKANALVTQLTQEKENFVPAPQPQPDDQLRQEMEALKQKFDDLQREHQKLREANAHLTEKNDLLQYEMIKARAQSSGLERVSFNYKNQLEDFLKKINAVQVTNDHLSQVKNRLEGMVEQIKSQNEELAQNNRLAQFELEKNRSRLAALEKENELLKSQGPQ